MQFHLVRGLARVIVECHGNMAERTIHFGGAGHTGYGVLKGEGQEKSQRARTFDLGLRGRFASLVIRGNVKPSSPSFWWEWTMHACLPGIIYICEFLDIIVLVIFDNHVKPLILIVL